MFDWLREIFEIRYYYHERKKELTICESCETLKMQLSIANDEKKMLLERLLDKPEPEKEPEPVDLKPVLPRTHLSWTARRQMLEATDRKTAQIMREREAEINKAEPISTNELEKEMDAAAQERENATK